MSYTETKYESFYHDYGETDIDNRKHYMDEALKSIFCSYHIDVLFF